MKFAVTPLKKLIPKPVEPALPRPKVERKMISHYQVNAAARKREREDRSRRELVAGGDILWKPIDKQAAKLLSGGKSKT